MNILDARIPLTAGGGTSIALRDTYGATDSMLVPILTTGLFHRANDLGNMPSYVRVPLINGGSSITAGEILAAQAGAGTMSLLSMEDGSGNWEWENGNEIEWPGETGEP